MRQFVQRDNHTEQPHIDADRTVDVVIAEHEAPVLADLLVPNRRRIDHRDHLVE